MNNNSYQGFTPYLQSSQMSYEQSQPINNTFASAPMYPPMTNLPFSPSFIPDYDTLYDQNNQQQVHTQFVYQEEEEHNQEPSDVPQPIPSTQKPTSVNPETRECYEKIGTGGWIARWINQEKQNKWNIGVPKFKYCKKRKDHFSDTFPEVWYKSPYKYHLQLDIEGMNENVIALVELNYEDGQKVVFNENPNKKNSKKKKKENHQQLAELSSGCISNNENYFVSESTGETSNSQATIGPFAYNICSYKQDGRKFRMAIHLYCQSVPENVAQSLNNNNSVELCCFLISPPFTIRAKKPISAPGSKKKESVQEGTSTSKSVSTKRLFSESMKQKHEENVVESNDVLVSEAKKMKEPIKEPTGLGEMDSQTKIRTIADTFRTMDDNTRRQLLDTLMQESLPAEKEFIEIKYFGKSMFPSVNTPLSSRNKNPFESASDDPFAYFSNNGEEERDELFGTVFTGF